MNFRELYAHMQWADAEVWRAIGEIRDEKLLTLMQHVHAVQHAFLLMWRNAPVDGKALYARRAAAGRFHRLGVVREAGAAVACVD